MKDDMATKVNMDRHIREGWTVGAFIRELAPQVETGTGGLVQGQPALLQEKDSRSEQPFCKNV